MKKILFIFFLASTVHSIAQVEDIDRMRPAMLRNFGRNAERLNDSYSAIKYYKAYLNKRSKDYKTIHHLAELEESTRNYRDAAQHYGEAFDSNNELYILDLYNKARMEKMLGNYDEARKEFEKFLKLGKESVDRDLRKQATSEMLGCDTAKMLVANPLSVAVENLGKNVNRPHIEFSPMPVSETEIIFGSLPETEVKSYALDEERPYRKLYLAEKVGDEWKNKGELDGPFNADAMHTGNGTYSPDGKRFYFTRCSEDWKLAVVCELWVSKKVGGKWSEPEKLDERINMPGYSSSQPTIGIETKKGKEIIYFVSDRPEGVGGSDIWYTMFDPKKGVYSDPKNAGKKINTPRNEMTPFYFEKEKKMFYSTEGRAGLGGFDIYETRGELKKWLDPSNVGYPINSSVDDIYYVLNESGESGFLVSNRKGGQQMLYETCCDDIYEFHKIDPVRLAIEAVAVVADNQKYVNGESDDLSGLNGSVRLDNASVDVYLIEKGQEILMKTIATDENGKFFMELEQDKQYRFEVRKEGFLNNNIELNTEGLVKSDTLQRLMGLSKELEGSIVIENIEFEFDSPNLTEEARHRIDNTLLKVLYENPDLKIEIGAHTDNRGTTEYNRKLSQQRAESVVKYLNSKGIETRRMEAKGYGESRPLVPNEKPDGSDDEAGRQKNRRTEFKVIGKVLVIQKPSDNED